MSSWVDNLVRGAQDLLQKSYSTVDVDEIETARILERERMAEEKRKAEHKLGMLHKFYTGEKLKK